MMYLVLSCENWTFTMEHPWYTIKKIDNLMWTNESARFKSATH